MSTGEPEQLTLFDIDNERPAIFCDQCGRPLRAERSRARHRGPVCHAWVCRQPIADEKFRTFGNDA